MSAGAGTRPLRRLLPWTAAAAVLVTGAVGALVVAGSASGQARWRPGSVAATVGPPPTRVRIPAIGVDSPLEDLTVDAHGALQAPKDFNRAGWYAEGTRPGDVGPAVIAGHVDSRTGPAVFFRLPELRPDDIVEVTRGGGIVKFRVLAVRRYPKTQFPTDEVYAPTPNAQLRLITCGGEFDRSRRSYVDNVVVYAVLI